MNARLRDYFELLRLPAVFTAIADILMGFLVVGGSFQPPWALALLVIASSLIYLAGMVLNDVHDAPIDTIERPGRPIPSGRISLETATRLGRSLLVCGIAAAWLVSYPAGTPRPGIVATLLAACVILYDMILKRTPAAPLLMGCCRLLNVLLGMSLAETTDSMLPRAWSPAEWAIAVGIGIYIVGVTIFARTEAQRTSRVRIVIGTVTMLLGVAVLGTAAESIQPATYHWILWPVFACWIILIQLMTIVAPDARLVQFSVRRALRILIFLDFAVASSVTPGSADAIAILALLVPMLILERFASTT